MPTPLLDTLRQCVTPDLVARASLGLGESESGTSKALNAAIPSVLAGMLAQASDIDAIGTLEALLGSSSNDGGDRFLDTIFGPHLGAIAGGLAQIGGIRASSASSLLGMAAPLIMSLLGSAMRSSGRGLASLLGAERRSILGAVPVGLSSLLIPPPTAFIPLAPAMPDQRSSGIGWRLPLLGLLVLGAALWALMSARCKGPTAGILAAPDSGGSRPKATATVGALAATMTAGLTRGWHRHPTG